jgi:hypothetical protein
VKLARETARPAMDRLSTFIAASAWASIVGGAALVISFLLEWLVVPYEKLGVAGADLTASYLTASSLRLLSTVLFLWALLALYNRQSIAAGTFGLRGFIVAFFGTALLVGNVWAEVFVWPTLARIAPNLVVDLVGVDTGTCSIGTPTGERAWTRHLNSSRGPTLRAWIALHHLRKEMIMASLRVDAADTARR